ncbi:MAG: HAMP domain-containing histidine kinase [Lachnospiraceae bacterium]|nr:HAMP domain-containing histidine kinase [Lachnospiraceae bacterium]
MVKKLQRKLQWVLSMVLILFVITILISTLFLQYMSSTTAVKEQIRAAEDRFLDNYYESLLQVRLKDGVADAAEEEEEETAIENKKVNAYGVVFDSEFKTLFTEFGNLSKKRVKKLALKMVLSQNESGIISHYEYRVRDIEENIQVTFIDRNDIQRRLVPVVVASLALGVMGIICVLILSFFLTKWLVRPITENVRRQKQFVADASHELKTPLAVIDVNLDMARSMPDNPKYLGYIKGETSKMSRLIQELLMLAQVEDQDTVDRSETFSLTDTVEGVLLPFEAAAYDRGVTIGQDVAEGLEYAGRAVDISRMVETLIENAIYHAKEGSEIFVTLKKEHKAMVLVVENDGDTIPEEQMQHIFERFYRIDKARNRKNGHFGLGLAIAKGTATRYGGTIHVTSEDGHTAFTVVLPIEK